jgi:hypothetical protein
MDDDGRAAMQADRSADLPGVSVPEVAVPACMDVIDVLEGFCLLEKRSPTLDGSVPLRAAQGCKPLLDGNTAGFQVRLSEPGLLRVKDGQPELHLTRASQAKLGPNYAAKVESLVAAGALAKDGYWHRALMRGVAHLRKSTLSLWTGLLIRPAPGRWILQSRAFNRRSQVVCHESVVADDTAFVPVILELPLDYTRDAETWLTSDLACLTPLCPHVEFTICSIEQEPDVGAAFNRFYSHEYRSRRHEKKPAGDYRRLVAGEDDTAAPAKADCRLVVAGGPSVHHTATFTRFLTGKGKSRTHPNQRDLQFAVLRNFREITGVFDGLGVEGVSADVQRAAARLRSRWKALYGEDALSPLETVTPYAVGSPPPRREPSLLVKPWAFVKTPPGWSSLTDGYHHGTLEGMRGVISTDVYFFVAPVLQCTEPGPFVIPRGARLERVLPVPRQLLEAPMRAISFSDFLARAPTSPLASA